MSRFVFVLGAGASAAGGAPIGKNFMEKAFQLSRNASLQTKDQEAFELVFKAREALKAVYSKAHLNLENIEELFNAFEMAALFNRLGALAENEVQALPSAMRRLIARTIELNLTYPVRYANQHSTGRVFPPQPYEQFTELLKKISQETLWDELCVITFNYDVAVDYALHFAGIPYTYGFGGDDMGAIELLKLHGSLNWYRCSKCSVVLPWHLRTYFQEHSWRNLIDVKEVKLQTSLAIPHLCHCDGAVEIEPTVVPPTWNKGSYHSQFGTVWRKAARHLSEAENIFIIGYSYPRTDEFFKYLYALGSIGDGWLNRVMVFDPDKEVGKRIGELLGPLARQRYESVEGTFELAISRIKQLNLN